MRIDPKIVIVGKRVRRDVDQGIRELSKSIQELGQLQPIVIDEDNNLIAGARRLRACELLERDVDAVIAEDVRDAIQKLKAERDENVCRLDFTPEEAVEAGRAIEEMERPKAKQRQKASGGNHANGKIGQANLAQPAESGKASDIAAEAVGMGKETYRKAKAVVEAAEEDPELRPVVDEMNRTGKVDPAYQKVREKAQPKPWTVLQDVNKFRDLRDKLCDNWQTNEDRAVMRQTFKQLANEV